MILFLTFLKRVVGETVATGMIAVIQKTVVLINHGTEKKVQDVKNATPELCSVFLVAIYQGEAFVGYSEAHRLPNEDPLELKVPRVRVICMRVGAFILANVLGLLSLIIPPYFFPGRQYTAPLFPLLRTGIETLSPLSILLLILSGSVPGYLIGESSVLWGLAVVAALPIAALAEMIVDPTSHNLWPIEFSLSYGFLALLGMLGASLGKRAKLFFKRSGNHDSAGH